VQVTETEVMVGAAVTVTVALPDLVVSWVDVAVMVADPVAAGVNTPPLLTAPMFDGLTDHATDVLKLPVPATVGVQVEVCVVRMESEEQTTETDVIVGGTTTVTLAEPALVESWVDVAVMAAVPAPEGVNTPAVVTVPPVADQLIAEL
jgi:hypothetical protein